ncbi:hypothetical protein FRC07_015096 [Ceratobasidium sp. 392]|nr:hypothetical protein FRC07_015096 [Ceratobasidium sp. 392]
MKSIVTSGLLFATLSSASQFSAWKARAPITSRELGTKPPAIRAAAANIDMKNLRNDLYLIEIKVGDSSFKVTNQSFCYVTQQDELFRQAQEQSPLHQGVLGLGFDTTSMVNVAVLHSHWNFSETWGRTLMTNIFSSNPSVPKFFAVFLNRSDDLAETDTARLDIGSYATGHEDVIDMPKHPLFSAYRDEFGFLWWSTLLKKLSVGGSELALKTKLVPGNWREFEKDRMPPLGTLLARFDTGTATADLPPAAFKALYESMGGVLINNTSLALGRPAYVVPCMAEAKLEFTFGEQVIAIHPLDLTHVEVMSFGNGQNFTVCLSLYKPVAEDMLEADLILGDAFMSNKPADRYPLRNVYTVYNWGGYFNNQAGFLPNTSSIQMLPLTDASTASDEFKKTRAKTLAQLPTEINTTTINDPHPQASGNTSSNVAVNKSTPALFVILFLSLVNVLFA